MVRPGRLDRMLYVDLPTAAERLDILKTITKKTPLDSTIDLEKIATDPRCEGFSGADLASLVREASVTALRTNIYKNETSIKKASTSLSLMDTLPDPKKIENIYVCPSHFDVAFSKIVRSVSPKVIFFFFLFFYFVLYYNYYLTKRNFFMFSFLY